MPNTALQLNPELETALSALATSRGKSTSFLINQAVQEYIDRNQQQAERWAETTHAIESVKAGQVVDEEAVHAWMESWGTEDELHPPTP